MTALDSPPAEQTHNSALLATAILGELPRVVRGPSCAEKWAVGDVVLCPGLGVGTIRGRTRCSSDALNNDYLVVEIAGRRPNLVMAVADAHGRGWRRPASTEELDAALVTLTCTPACAVPGWKARQRIHRAKLARGTVADAADVVRDLAWVQSECGLGLSERGPYESARAILESELAFAFGLDARRARRRLDQLLASARPPVISIAPSLEPDRR